MYNRFTLSKHTLTISFRNNVAAHRGGIIKISKMGYLFIDPMRWANTEFCGLTFSLCIGLAFLRFGGLLFLISLYCSHLNQLIALKYDFF